MGFVEKASCYYGLHVRPSGLTLTAGYIADCIVDPKTGSNVLK